MYTFIQIYLNINNVLIIIIYINGKHSTLVLVQYSSFLLHWISKCINTASHFFTHRLNVSDHLPQLVEQNCTGWLDQ